MTTSHHSKFQVQLLAVVVEGGCSFIILVLRNPANKRNTKLRRNSEARRVKYRECWATRKKKKTKQIKQLKGLNISEVGAEEFSYHHCNALWLKAQLKTVVYFRMHGFPTDAAFVLGLLKMRVFFTYLSQQN